MVLCIGEILADLIGSTARDGAVVYTRHAGGAPFNVACGVKAVDGACGFIGRVGDDLTGKFLRAFAREKHFEFLNIETDPRHNTTLAFVEIDAGGERSFCFARKQTADYLIEDDFESSLSRADIVHIGSLMLSEPQGRTVCERAFAAAAQQGKKISFDVNFRDDLFGYTDAAREMFLNYVRRADIVKVSEEELVFLCGAAECARGEHWYVQYLRKLCDKPDKAVALTLGANGCAVCFRENVYLIAAQKITPVDTTGAGDAFYAAFLAGLDRRGFTAENVVRSARLANVAAGYTTLQYGAIAILPPLAQMELLAETLPFSQI